MEAENWTTGKVVLRVGGEPVEMEMTVPAFKIKPQRMLPIFQQMSSAVVGISVSSVESHGEKISCTAGCGACCRQAVPISEVEAYQIAELVDAMPEPRRTEVRQRFAGALGHFTEMKWFDELIDLQDMAYENTPGFSPKKYMEVVTNYMREGIACPFLEDESCSIHPVRPLICREYLVTSPAENCQAPTAETIKKVPIAMKPSNAMLKVGRTKNSAGMSSLMLIEALDFVKRHPDEFEEKTGQEWAAEFFEKLTKSEIPAPAAKPATIRKKRSRKRGK